MTTSLRLRRGTTAQHSTFTGADGEVTVDTSKKTLVVHDGATPGGFAVARETALTASVRYDTASQGLNTTQKNNARLNIGASPTASGPGFMVQMADGQVGAAQLVAGPGMSLDWSASDLRFVNAGVTDIGGLAGAVILGSGLSVSGGQLHCTLTVPVTSVAGNTGAITAQQLKDAVVSSLGYTPANPASFVPLDTNLGVGSFAFCNMYIGTASAGGAVAGSSLKTAAISPIDTDVQIVGAPLTGTWRNLTGATVNNGYFGLFQRIA